MCLATRLIHDKSLGGSSNDIILAQLDVTFRMALHGKEHIKRVAPNMSVFFETLSRYLNASVKRSAREMVRLLG